jgi:hypothetical protein
MKYTHIFGFILSALGILAFASQVQAAVFYGAGVYTNLCGTGLNATANSCQRGCNTNTGSCSAAQPGVVKFTCDGRLSECRSNESTFATTQSVSGTACGKTVQIDVFSKTCRVNGNWTCTDQQLQDYIVWYSGDCQTQPTATPTHTPKATATPKPTATTAPTRQPTTTPTSTPQPIHTASCSNLSVVSGNNALIPANLTFRATASDSQGDIQKYRFFFGDGSSMESSTPEVQHRYTTSGTFKVRTEIRDSRSNWRADTTCETTATVKPVPVIEGHKSNCANVFITEGNHTQAPSTVKFTVNGFDNKGSITNYRLDFGDGTVLESASGNFEKRYETPGTYVIKGYVYDSKNNWKGGDQNCRVSLYVNTKPMEKQPETGTPTLFSLLGIGSGAVSLGLVQALRTLKHKRGF